MEDLVKQELWDSAHILGQFLTSSNGSLCSKSQKQKSADYMLFGDIVYGMG